MTCSYNFIFSTFTVQNTETALFIWRFIDGGKPNIIMFI